MHKPTERLECPKCGEMVQHEDLTCPHCRAPLETVLVKRATRGRRYVYGKRKAGLSPEVIWLLIVILIGLLIIVGAQLFAFMRSRKLVERPHPAARVTMVLPARTGESSCGGADDSGNLPRYHQMSAGRADSASAVADTTARKGTRHGVRLRHLCHAHRPPGGSASRPGGTGI
ncbi:hypothetical protein LLH23_16200 [bacterium]|nr:hypothetical protein [bacterium]